jgi:hypothetical protein
MVRVINMVSVLLGAAEAKSHCLVSLELCYSKSKPELLGQQKEAYASDNEHGSWKQRQNTLLLI